MTDQQDRTLARARRDTAELPDAPGAPKLDAAIVEVVAEDARQDEDDLEERTRDEQGRWLPGVSGEWSRCATRSRPRGKQPVREGAEVAETCGARDSGALRCAPGCGTNSTSRISISGLNSSDRRSSKR